MSAYYNEIDAYAAQWLRNLIAKNLIAKGDVDERSICDVDPNDLKTYKQCHFFAGIGGWSHALRLAGWPDDRPIWTGSAPCQPFSVAGKGAGTDDPRHLWPHFHRLIAAWRPPVVMGEQVAGKAGYGWFDGVRADLEGSGYSSRGADLPALAVNAPHIRQRLYWVAVADATDGGRQFVEDERSASVQPMVAGPGKGGEQSGDLRAGILCNSHMADTALSGWGQGVENVGGVQEGDSSQGPSGRSAQHDSASFWSDATWLTGSDGKSLRAKPGLPLLAHGVSNRVGRLRAYGNAIVPPLAAEVIKAFMECEP